MSDSTNGYQDSDWLFDPGSIAAVQIGCLCPIFDNAFGKGRFGLGRDWWINAECPLHGTISRRADARGIHDL